MKNNSLLQKLPKPLILTSFNAMQSSRDGAAAFLQEANFLWLTGINEPGWLYVADSETTYLIAPNKSSVQEVFDGGLSPDEAGLISGVDKVVSCAEGEELIKNLSKKYSKVYTLGADPQADSYDFTLNSAPAELRTKLDKAFKEVADCRKELSALRAIKSEDEIIQIQTAIDATIDAFRRAYKVLPNTDYEYQVEAELTYAIRSSGATGHAYEPIVASGKNALTLHYSTNSDKLPNNGLVLIDVGARVGGYAADITRTYAVGKPTDRQIEVHAALKQAHEQIIELIKPEVSFKKYHSDVDEIMKSALQKLGLLKDRTDSDTYRKYFPHAISHGLGIDVHESLGGFKSFQPGMVLTVEPGIYIAEEGIGMRIEDDILVTNTGRLNLSAGLPTSL